MEPFSPRPYTSLGHHYELDNSYVREVFSRQGMAATPNLAAPVGRTHLLRPTTTYGVKQNFTTSTDSLPVEDTVERGPSKFLYRSTSNAAYKPPSHYSPYRPPNQSVYKPLSQSAYRPPDSPSVFRPSPISGQKMNVRHNDEEIPVPEPVKCDDQQIFVRKPRCTTITPPIFRLGSHGAPWKHVKSVINTNGSHLCWIDGSLKQDENVAFPMNWHRYEPRRIIRRTIDKSCNVNFKYWHRNNVPAQYTDYSKINSHGKQMAA